MFNNFPDRLYVLRRLRGVNHCEVAYALGVTPSSVSAWELGKCTPQCKTMMRIAKEFDCSLSWLLGETPIDDIKGAEND